MNKTFRIVGSAARGAFIVAHEHEQLQRRRFWQLHHRRSVDDDGERDTEGVA